MPGYLISGDNQYASQIPIVPSGTIDASNVQDAIEELDTEKAPSSGISQSSITNLVSDLSAKSPLNSPNFTGTLSAETAVVSGNLTVDTNTLIVDSNNNRVGINKSSPSSPLHVTSLGNTSIDGPTSGTWATKIVQNQASNTHSGLSVHSRWGGSDGKIFEAARGWNGASEGYFPALTVNGAGNVITPNQPAIHLDGNFANWTTWGASSDQVISQFSTEFSRGGMSYNGSGRITVPVSGYYIFYYQLYVGSVNQGRANLRKNGADLIVGQFTGASVDRTAASSIIVSCSANDYVEIIGTNFDSIVVYMGGRHSFFGGYFLG